MTRPEPRHDDHRWPSPPDPGDLSRRVAQRRAELHLSQGQVAARAGLSLRYLEYLERYPARPTPAASGGSHSARRRIELRPAP
jgi:DNA-binding transcriptional regulator YiaG